jgi:ssDNA-binding Zn-finger/Zn-ribbon topoisomerase 1
MNITKSCPECGVGTLLVIKRNRTTGEEFLGCPRWPNCTYAEPLPETIKLRRQGQKDMFEGDET